MATINYVKREKCQTNNITLPLNQLEKEQQNMHQVIRRKQIIKITVEIKATEKTKQWGQSTKPKLVLRMNRRHWQPSS